MNSKMLIIANPAAQSGAAREAAERMRRFLSLYDHEKSYELVYTEHAGHATELAAAATGYETVFALGGDGVVHEVANGLMRIPKTARPVMGVIPVGSGNDYARTLGIPASLVETAELQLGYRPTPMDVGRIEYMPTGCTANSDEAASPVTEYFVETFSFGLDAAIAIDTVERRQRTGLTGGALYTASGLDVFGRRYRNFPVHVRVDEADLGEIRPLIFAVQIGPTYGSGFRICPDADPSDGLFDICFAAGRIPRAVALPLFLCAKNGKHVGFKPVHQLRCRQLELQFCESDYPIQADGEQLHATSAAISIEPAALQVLRPAQRSASVPR